MRIRGGFRTAARRSSAPSRRTPTSSERPEKTWSINFRVSDLDGMVEQLRAAGVAVQPHAEGYPNGRFAELVDPEGNHIQLWEPNDASVARDPAAG